MTQPQPLNPENPQDAVQILRAVVPRLTTSGMPVGEVAALLMAMQTIERQINPPTPELGDHG